MALELKKAYLLTLQHTGVHITGPGFGLGGVEIDCYRKEDVDAVLSEKDAEIANLKFALRLAQYQHACTGGISK